MNRFDAYITDYLHENKEVALEKIGYIKIVSAGNDNQVASVEYIFDKKITTSTALVEYIAEKASKNKNIVAADLESHFRQVREFINIGKSYELPQLGFIKANRHGVYEFTRFSETNKPVRTGVQPAQPSARSNNRSIIQIISLVIAIAILSGLGWQVYQIFSKKQKNTVINTVANADTAVTQAPDSSVADSATPQQVVLSPDDSLNVRYIFETTASGLRARTRTAQLKDFGNDAGYDSLTINNTKYYKLYIVHRTKLADTLIVKDSLAKFLQKNITVQVDTAR